MKTTSMLVVATLLASIGLASAADSRPMMHHHRHCTTQFIHHHKVTRCH